MIDNIENIDMKHKKKYSFNELFFLSSCEHNNIELMKWIKMFDFDIRDEVVEICFHIACENHNLIMADYTYYPYLNINTNSIIDIIIESDSCDLLLFMSSKLPFFFDFFDSVRLYEIFEVCCYNNINTAMCIYALCTHIPIYLYNHKLFIEACRSNNISICNLLTGIRPDLYYLYIEDEDVVQFEIKNNIQINNKKNVSTKEKCFICLENTANVCTLCKHFYCIDCLETHYIKNNIKCPYCRKENYEKDLFFLTCTTK